MHPTDDAAALYETWFGRLSAIGTEEFRIDEADADELAHEVLLSSLVGGPSRQSGEWLMASMRSASRRRAHESGKGR